MSHRVTLGRFSVTYVEHYRKSLLRNYLGFCYMEIRKILHPLLKTIISKQPMPKIVVLNEPPELSGNVIYVINHSCKYDVPVTGICIPEHFYYFVGKQRLEIVDRIFFFLNGVIYVDRMDKNHRKQIKGKVEKLLRRGKSLWICPEGTWNYLPSTPLLPLYWGCIDFAKDCEVPIVPIALDYEEDKCYVKWGQPLFVPPL